MNGLSLRGSAIVMMGLAIVIACGSPIPAGTCTTPRVPVASPYHGKLETKIEGGRVTEDATVRVGSAYPSGLTSPQRLYAGTQM